MDRIISTYATKSPEATAIQEGNQSLTYRELDRKVARLASAIQKHGLEPEEPICILADLGAEMVIAQLAVIRLGLTCIPLITSTPRLRLTSILKDVGTKYILSDMEDAFNENEFIKLPISSNLEDCHGYDVPGTIGADGVDGDDGDNAVNGNKYSTTGCQNQEYRSHILYTSGTTGKPKPVQVMERSILHLVTKSPLGMAAATDRVALINNPGFDISPFEIFFGLIGGATLFVVPREVITDPFAVRNVIAEKRLSVIYLTSTLFAIIAHACPTTFHGVKHVLIGGSVANKAAVEAVLNSSLPPEHLWNTYAPTEMTTHALMHLITAQELQYETISIGKPFGDGKCCLMDEHMETITTPGQVGEIFLSGPGLTRGYIGLPEENEHRFVKLEDGRRYYRTGDRAKRREGADDVLEFVGRTDSQVKHGGFRVELGEIQHMLLSSGYLSEAVVFQVPGNRAGDSTFLVAFVIPAIAHTLKVGELDDYLRERLPVYMIPSEIVFLQELPLDDRGKVDRKALTQRYLAKREAKTSLCKERWGTKEIVRSLWSSILNKASFTDDDDFFELGGTSLQAAALISKLRGPTGRTISMRGLVEHSRLDMLVRYLGDFVEGGNAPDEADRWIADARLADGLEIEPSWSAEDWNSVIDWTIEKEGRLLVTGVTGYVAAHFISRLANLPEVQEIVCLARAKQGLTPRQRIEKSIERYDLREIATNNLDKLVVLEGDITQKNLGLPIENYARLADRISAIFHLAAKVNYCEPYSAHFEANVLGTRNILALAAQGRRKAFHYMSSLDVWGPTGLIYGTRELFEDEALLPHIGPLRYDIGYAPSQWVSEEMVRRARDRGLPTVIYRPGFIIGDTRHGAGNPNDFVSRLFLGSIRLGAFPQLPNQRLEYVTVDYVCDSILRIATDKKNLGRSYCIVPPSLEVSVDMEQSYEIIVEVGYPLRLLPYWDWIRELQETNGQDNPAKPLLPMLQEPVIGGLSRFQTSRQAPRYDCTNTMAVLKNAPEIHYTPLSADLLRKFLDFWRRKGFFVTD
ncbi:non-ribosomal peptide synthetase [Aspergillus homomorphus CBS 101889]|uniref:Acetyl-CoA synthetase-like protein n=1 Tax=Aspergillus homomorphus (strain CBS 101889) TaxID=1450537 RepID=A0A395HLW4_ASPHC|nr:acetyl-CoA synthetase-like protein [Aspergillus homomorphus CBS 101889]RAL08479.1 acetyl-CoA synthetase-like protein [Aspergillus homomorphus CBS 101889]